MALKGQVMVMVAHPPLLLLLDIKMDHTLKRGRRTSHQVEHMLLLTQTDHHILPMTHIRRSHRPIMS